MEYLTNNVSPNLSQRVTKLYDVTADSGLIRMTAVTTMLAAISG